MQVFQQVVTGSKQLKLENFRLLGWESNNKFIVGCPVTRCRDFSPGNRIDERDGFVTGVSLHDDLYIYSVEFIKGFDGPAIEHNIPECDLTENVKLQQGRPARSAVTLSLNQGTC